MDVYDTLVSERPNKRAWTAEAARDHIAGQRGRHFDPTLVDIFLARYDDFIAIREGLKAEAQGSPMAR